MILFLVHCKATLYFSSLAIMRRLQLSNWLIFFIQVHNGNWIIWTLLSEALGVKISMCWFDCSRYSLDEVTVKLYGPEITFNRLAFFFNAVFYWRKERNMSWNNVKHCLIEAWNILKQGKRFPGKISAGIQSMMFFYKNQQRNLSEATCTYEAEWQRRG